MLFYGLLVVSISCQTNDNICIQHESGLCKNILQQYAQKCHFALPVYTFVKSGETHSPLFNGSVKIGGVTYTGGICKSKKEAEIKAAKTALIAICSDPGLS